MRILVAFGALCLVLAGCTGSDGDGGLGSPGSSSTGPGMNGTNPGMEPQPDELDLAVDATGTYPANPDYALSTQQVPAGALVHVTFRNRDTNPVIAHNWVVDGIANASSGNIDPGEQVKFDFKAPAEAGAFTYYCSIGDHRQRGMEGTLTVTVS